MIFLILFLIIRVINLPNLDELLFLIVLALPKASKIGLLDNILFSIN